MLPSAEAVALTLWQQLPDFHAVNAEDGIKMISDALTAYAAQQVQATWEEAADKVAEYMGSGSDVEAEFRRRAQEGMEKHD